MKKILIIEDNLDVRENLAEILELSNYEVFDAPDGKVGVEIAVKELPDLILCDVMMPELDGFGVLHILNKNPKTSDIPFIFLTAKAEKTDFRTGMNLGADDYITKPFDDVELLKSIEMRLKKSERLKKSFNKSGGGLSSFITEAKATEALRQLSENRSTRTFRKKDFIFREGDAPHNLFFINKGKVKTFKTNEEGKDYIINVFKEGDFLGHVALIKQTTYTESAAALEETEVSLIPKDDFSKLLFSNRDISNRFVKMLADNVAENETHLINLAYNSVRKRVADALVLLHEKYEKEGESKFAILREDIAQMAGTAKETVIRTLTDFKEEKLIEIEGRKIVVMNKEKLQNMPN